MADVKENEMFRESFEERYGKSAVAKKREVENYIRDHKCPVVIQNYPIHGDSGMNILSCYLDSSVSKWVVEKAVERTNSVSRREFDSEYDAWDYIYGEIKYM